MASLSVQSQQTNFHGLQERLPWLVQNSCLIWTHIITHHTRYSPEIIYIYIPVILWYSEPVIQPANVFSNSGHCTVCMMSSSVAIGLNTWNRSDISGDCAILIKTENKTVDFVISRLLFFPPWKPTMRPEETHCKRHICLYGVLQGRPECTVQYSISETNNSYGRVSYN